jgi:UDP-N-acetylmuramoylalanine--D-glutamate ligase
MTPVTCFAGRHVALFGLGLSGRQAAQALLAGGASVTAWDDTPASLDRAGAEGIATADLRKADWSGFDALVLAPGVPLTHPAPHWTVELARAANVPVIGDVELFCQERRHIAPGSPFVAITGTNGKSTTTALIAHVLRAAGRKVEMGGNIGTAILALAPPAPDRVHVVECSSFQIDLAPSLQPGIGIQLNLTPDHLDRHGTLEAYAAIKERLVQAADIAIIGVDDAHSAAMARRRQARGLPLLRVSAEAPVDAGVFAGVTAREGRLETRLVRVTGLKPRIVAELTGIPSLRGTHNAQNAAAAFAACAALGVEEEVIAAALKTYPGLPHRMEEVARKGRVVFINDSKATNADSTEKALTSFQEIYWILGGKPKAGGIESLRRYFPNIAKAYLIGEATEGFAVTLGADVPFARCGTLDVALRQAAGDAAAAPGAGEACVLLSPACASYDQFPNFEVRGDAFRSLVRAL